MNLILALFWLALAAALFTHEALTGSSAFRIQRGGVNLSAGWLMLVLAAYNLVRWWSSRRYQQIRRAEQAAAAERERANRLRHRPEPIGDPDPNFVFTDEPPPPPQRNLTDRPPSNN
jgi:hypothetical protein